MYSGGYLARTAPTNLYSLDLQKQIQDRYVSKAEGLLPYYHPPYEALLFAPLSKLPFRSAYVAFLIANLSLLAACFFLCREALSQPGTLAQPKPGLQIFLFYPVVAALLLGQDSLVFLAGLCAVCIALLRHRLFISGLALSLLLFRPQLAVPIGFFLAVRFGYSFLAGLFVGCASVSLVSWALVGWSGLEAFVRLIFLTGSENLVKGAPNPLGIPPGMANVKGLVLLTAPSSLSPRGLFIIVFVASFLIVVWVVKELRKRFLTDKLAFSLSVAAGLVLSFHSNVYDLVILLLPLGLTARETARGIVRVSWTFFVVPPFLALLGQKFFSLLCLPLFVLINVLTAESVPLPKKLQSDRSSVTERKSV